MFYSPTQNDVDFAVSDTVSDTTAANAEARAPLTFDEELLAGFRQGYRQYAVSIAGETLTAGANATKTILQLCGWVQEMKMRLNRKEFGVFVKGLLQWVGEEARKYLDIARTFKDFDLTRLQKLEPFTLLKLRSKRYAPVVERLLEESDITPKVVQGLIGELLPSQPRKKPITLFSGWKQSRSGGARYYNVLLHDEATGLSIEQQALAEGILPQRVIAEAVAIRAKHKEAGLEVQGTELVANLSSDTNGFQEQAPHQEEVEEVASTQYEEYLEEQPAAIVVSPEAVLAGEDLTEIQWLLNAPIDSVEAVISSVAHRSAYRALYLLNRFQSGDAKRMELLEQRVTEYHIAIGAVEPTAARATEQITEDSPSYSTVDCGGRKVFPKRASCFYRDECDGSRGYIEKFIPATGKAVVLLQGDYRSKHFFKDELNLVEPVSLENSSVLGAEPAVADSSDADSASNDVAVAAAAQVEPPTETQSTPPTSARPQKPSNRKLQPVEILHATGEWIGGYFVHNCIAVAKLVGIERQFTLFDADGEMCHFLGQIRQPRNMAGAMSV